MHQLTKASASTTENSNPMITDKTQVVTVSQLNAQAKHLLESHFLSLAVSGELSNCVLAPSGHLYFSLKDDRAQIRCAFFHARRHPHTAQLKNGQQVIVIAKPSLYSARGDYQLIVSNIKPSGMGELYLQFEALKKELDQAGYFDPQQKKTLPRYPKTIGLITSPKGAALQDLLTVLQRRYPIATLTLYPCQVQGAPAAKDIAKAIYQANEQSSCDVLILARGGGSIEDLWPFNERCVAEALFQSRLPVITGIGHEVDHTIADFIADHRAATPSAAAETATPDQQELYQHLDHYHQQLLRAIKNHCHRRQEQLNTLAQRLSHPRQQLNVHLDRLTTLQHRLQLAIEKHWKEKQTQFNITKTQLQALMPSEKLSRYQQTLRLYSERLLLSIQCQLNQKKQSLNLLSQALDHNSPLKILNQGYAIVTDPATKTILTDPSHQRAGDRIHVQVAKGSFDAVIEFIPEDDA